MENERIREVLETRSFYKKYHELKDELRQLQKSHIALIEMKFKESQRVTVKKPRVTGSFIESMRHNESSFKPAPVLVASTESEDNSTSLDQIFVQETYTDKSGVQSDEVQTFTVNVEEIDNTRRVKEAKSVRAHKPTAQVKKKRRAKKGIDYKKPEGRRQKRNSLKERFEEGVKGTRKKVKEELNNSSDKYFINTPARLGELRVQNTSINPLAQSYQSVNLDSARSQKQTHVKDKSS